MEEFVKQLSVNLDSQTALEIARIWQVTSLIETGAIILFVLMLCLTLAFIINRAV